MSEVISGNGHDHHEGQIVQSGIPMDLIEAARGNVDVLEKLLNLWERRVDRDREIAANKALVRLRNSIPQIERKGKVDTGKGKYAYAEMEDIDETIRPHMKEQGWTFSFRAIEETNDYILVEGMLIHEETGWVFRSPRREPIIIGPGQNRAQAGGASQTYACRYLKIGMLDLVLKGEDTDGRPQGRASGPTTPPPSEKSMTNKWAAQCEEVLRKSGNNWWKTLTEQLALAEQSDDLEALIDLVRDNVNRLDKPKQNEIGAALMKARMRLSEAKPRGFDFMVSDANGETDGEIFTDPHAWGREFMEYWNSATTANDRENLLHHNADALDAARKANVAALKPIDVWQKETQTDMPRRTGGDEEDVVPLTFDAVQPPMNNGKPSWSAWHKLFVDDLMSLDDPDREPEDIASWIEAQRQVMGEADILHRQMAVSLVAKVCDQNGIARPEWLRLMILPINAAANHKEWGEARIAELYWIDTKEAFDGAIKDAMKRMQLIKKEDPATFDRVKAAFTDKQASLS